MGCRVSVAVLIKGITGNVTTMAIAPAGQSTCGETYSALTTANLQTAIGGAALSLGLVELSRVGSGNDTLAAGFGTFTLNNLIRSYGGSSGHGSGVVRHMRFRERPWCCPIRCNQVIWTQVPA